MSLSNVYNCADAKRGPFPRPAKGFSVRVQLQETEDKGIGAFAAEFIPANTKVIKIAGKSRYFDEDETLKYLQSLPSEQERIYWLDHVYGFKDKVAEDAYDQPIINHSDSPNLLLVLNDYNDGYIYALHDIQEGEELTEDYRSYPELPFLDQLLEQHGIFYDYLSG